MFSKSNTYIQKTTNNSNFFIIICKKGFSFRKYYYFLEKAGSTAIIVLQMYCHYKCSVALSDGAVGSAAMCGCDIS